MFWRKGTKAKVTQGASRRGSTVSLKVTVLEDRRNKRGRAPFPLGPMARSTIWRESSEAPAENVPVPFGVAQWPPLPRVRIASVS